MDNKEITKLKAENAKLHKAYAKALRREMKARDSLDSYKVALEKMETKYKKIQDILKKIQAEADKVRIHLDELGWSSGWKVEK